MEEAVIVDLQQGTGEWKAYRSKKIGASDASVILRVSPYTTPHTLWCYKTGRKSQPDISFVADRGNRWEPIARSRYELTSDVELPATTLVSQRYKWLMASLDGYNAEKKIILEIKCFTSKKNFQMAKDGQVPPMYVPQLQQQLFVSGASEVHFFCCLIETKNGSEFISDTALVIVKPDNAYIQETLLPELIFFHNCIVNDIAPPLTDRDYLELDDQSSVFMFSEIKQKKTDIKLKEQQILQLEDEIKLLEVQLDELRERAIEEAENVYKHPRIDCCGVRMSKNKDGEWAIRLAAEESA